MIAYLLKSAACLLLLLLVYHAFLEREKMHRFNRWFLIGSLILGLIIPLVTINFGGSPQLSKQITEINRRLTVQQPAETRTAPQTVPGPSVTESQADSTNGYAYLLIAYLIVASVMTVRLLRNLYAIYAKMKNHKQAAWRDATLILVEDDSPPHSFFNCIFINKRLYETGNVNSSVLAHEYAHVRQKHSFDIILIELLKVVFWFNPVLYFYKRAMQLNHEFLADKAAISESNDVQQYQKLLLKLQSGNQDLQLASSIQFSLTKRRIVMMTQTTSRFRMICKQLALIPVLAGLIVAFSTRTSSAQSVQQMSLTELIQAVNKRMHDVDSLSNEEKDKLQDLVFKMQEKLQPEKSASPKPPKKLDERNVLRVFINEEGMIRINEEAVPLKKVASKVKEFINNNGSDPELSESPEKAVVNVKITEETPMGAYTDVIKEIRKAQPAQIIFDKPHPNPPPPPPPPMPNDAEPAKKLEAINKAYNEYGAYYNSMKPTEANREKLQEAYDRTMMFYKQIDELQSKVYENPPPLPPRPSNPAGRIETYSKPQLPVEADTTDFDQISKKYSVLIDKYLDTTAIPDNREALDSLYQELSEIYDHHKEHFRENDKSRPLPPPPVNPTDRIKNNSKEL